MKILYVACYPDQYFERIQRDAIRSSSQPSQKFNYLMMRGFAENGQDVVVLNTLDQDAVNKKEYHKENRILEEDQITYILLPVSENIRKNRGLAKKSIKKFLTEWSENNRDSVIVMDVLKPYAEYIAKYAGKMPVISIVTDLSEHLYFTNSLKTYIRKKVKVASFNYIIKKSSEFVFLTEKMNQKLNTRHKPYIVVEGLVDSTEAGRQYDPDRHNDKFVCMYTGALHRRYGVADLVEAFTFDEMRNIELHVYGNGDYEKELVQFAEQYSNIKYWGVVDNKTIVKRQKEASLLINPRPVDAEFAEYSFPSKNMEYMLSGTPVLTTDLPGMPEEYKKYVYILNASSSRTIAERIKEISALPDRARNEMGKTARAFILANKNNVIQTSRIVAMIGKVINNEH